MNAIVPNQMSYCLFCMDWDSKTQPATVWLENGLGACGAHHQWLARMKKRKAKHESV